MFTISYTKSHFSLLCNCQGTFRYNELKRFLDPISFKTLTSNLKDLEDCGLIIRKEYQEVPPKVEYYLSDKGNSLMPILDQLCDWGEKNKQEI